MTDETSTETDAETAGEAGTEAAETGAAEASASGESAAAEEAGQLPVEAPPVAAARPTPTRASSNPLTEYFTLRALGERVVGVTPEARETALAALRLSRQKVEAAETLWGAGSLAESLRLATASYESARAAADALHAFVRGANPTGERFGGFGIRKGRLATLLTAEHAADPEKSPLPALDDEVRAKHHDRYRTLLEGRATLDQAVLPLTFTARQLTMTRARRIAVTAAVSLFALLVAGWVLTPRRGITATASGYWSNVADFEPLHAIDGDPSTEWVLDDAREGWIDVQLSPSRNVRSVQIRNGHNRQFNDRGAKDVRVELLRGGSVIAQANHTFEFSPNPEFVTIPVAASGVDVVRVRVLTWFQLGGAITDVIVDE